MGLLDQAWWYHHLLYATGTVATPEHELSFKPAPTRTPWNRTRSG